MGSRRRGTAAVSLRSAPFMELGVVLKPMLQTGLPVLVWVQQKLHWSSLGRGLPR